jgi:hypothetical protein
MQREHTHAGARVRDTADLEHLASRVEPHPLTRPQAGEEGFAVFREVERKGFERCQDRDYRCDALDRREDDANRRTLICREHGRDQEPKEVGRSRSFVRAECYVVDDGNRYVEVL